MKEIPCTQGQVALVDDEDFEELSKYKWCSYRDYNTWYVVRRLPASNKKIKMHQQIMQPPTGSFVDHRDGNGLNNCRSNLRICSAGENARNRGASSGRRFKGVYWVPSCNAWKVLIQAHGVQEYLGLFKSELDAARAYNKAAIERHGDFARLNEVPDDIVEPSTATVK